MAQLTLPANWKWKKLGDICSIKGGGTPSRKIKHYFQGDIPWITVKDLREEQFEITTAQEYITKEAVANSSANLIEPGAIIVATRVGLGKLAINKIPVAINQDLKALRCQAGIDSIYVMFAIYNSFFHLLKFGQGSTVKGIRQEDLLDLEISLPPLPVQRAIVTILSQAEVVRSRHLSANEMAGNILSTIFEDMFGVPSRQEPQLVSLGDGITDIRNGISRRRKQIANEGTIVLRIQDVGDGWIDYSSPNRIPIDEEEQEIYKVKKGDLLLVRVNGNKKLVGRNVLFRGYTEPTAFNDHLMRVRLNQERFLPEYVDGYLRSLLGQREIERHVFTSAGNYSINQTGVQSIQIPDAPLEKQYWFAQIYDYFLQQTDKFTNGIIASKALFQVLLSRTFTGELIAEWEAEHADRISAETARLQRRPKWALLTLIKWQQTGQDRPLGITSLMKYTFLAQQEGQSLHQPINHFYNFVPYHFGPFAKELYADLAQLEAEGWVTVQRASDDDPETPERIEITLVPDRTDEVESVVSELSEEELMDLAAIIERYGNLSPTELLDTVYDQYPAYAKKSRRRRT